MTEWNKSIIIISKIKQIHYTVFHILQVGDLTGIEHF